MIHNGLVESEFDLSSYNALALRYANISTSVVIVALPTSSIFHSHFFGILIVLIPCSTHTSATPAPIVPIGFCFHVTKKWHWFPCCFLIRTLRMIWLCDRLELLPNSNFISVIHRLPWSCMIIAYIQEKVKQFFLRCIRYCHVLWCDFCTHRCVLFDK